MNEIIVWLIGVEDRACSFYERAAAHFSHDAEFSGFLLGLSDDEKSHGRILRRAAELLTERGQAAPMELPSSLVRLEDGMVDVLDGIFSRCESGLNAGTATKDEIMEHIITIEYSEWNGLFLYVLNAFKRYHKEFDTAAMEIHRHKRRIERYIAAYSEYKGCLDKMRRRPIIWEEKILVADGEFSITEVLTAVLGNEGVVETAANGQIALDMLSAKYYNVVVSEVDLPVMDGIEFYKRACGKFPSVKERFLFFTASSDPERIGFLEQHEIPHLQKPAGIKRIRNAVIELLDRDRR